VLGNPYLRTISMSTATFNLFGSMMYAILAVYLIRGLDMSPATIGAIFAVGQGGYLVGALFASRISRWIGVGPAIVIGGVTGVAQLLVPIAPQDARDAIPFLVVSTFVVSFGIVLYNVTQLSMRQAITPERLQGRMNSTIRFIVWGVMPIGQLTGGALATAFDLRTAIWVGAIGCSVMWLPLVIGPVKSLREVPQVEEKPPAAETEGEALMPGPFPRTEET
jgi:MFS family permease